MKDMVKTAGMAMKEELEELRLNNGDDDHESEGEENDPHPMWAAGFFDKSLIAQSKAPPGGGGSAYKKYLDRQVDTSVFPCKPTRCLGPCPKRFA